METLMLAEDRSPGTLKRGGDDAANLTREVISKLFRNWYWFLISLVICLGIARIYLRYVVPIYNIESRLMIKKPSASGSQQEVIGQLIGTNNSVDVQNEIEVIRTKFLMKRVVHDLQLNVKIFSKGNIKSTEVYKTAPFRINLLYLSDSAVTHSWQLSIDPNSHEPALMDALGQTKIHWGDTIRLKDMVFSIQPTIAPFPEGSKYLLWITPEDGPAVEYLGKLTVAPIADGVDIIRMTIADPFPLRGEDILNTLYDEYVKANIEDQSALADNTIKFIESRLDIVSGELSGVEKHIEDFKSSNNLIDIAQQSSIVTQNANDLQKQLVQQDVQLEVLQSIEDQLKQKQFRVVPASLVTQSPVYTTLVDKFNALILERDAQLETSKPGNPIILQLNDRIETVRNDLRTELGNIRKELMVHRNNLSARISESIGAIKSMPAKQRAFLDISRQQEVKQQLYLFLLQKREETAISKSGTTSNSRLIDPARADMVPFAPNNKNIYLIGLALGLLIPAAGLYLSEFLNNRIRDRKDVSARTQAPIIGQIGHNDEGNALVVKGDSRSFIAEQFRTVRTNLRFVLTGKQHQVILITSSMSGEGKSFVSLNLASSLAISGKKVALLELDLRKPRLSQQIDIPNEMGFTNYIVSNMDLKYLPKKVPGHPNLYLINSGPIPPNPAELLLQDKVKVLFEYLNANFDYIIVDTPPVGLVTDALLVGSYANACIYVVRENYTLRQQLAIIDDMFSSNKLQGISVLVNDADARKQNGYGYNYGDGAYYSNPEGRRSLPERMALSKKARRSSKPESNV